MNPEEGLGDLIDEQDRKLKEQYDKQNDPGPQPDPLEPDDLKNKLTNQITGEDRYRTTPARLAAATAYEIGQATAVNLATSGPQSVAGPLGVLYYVLANFGSGAQSNYVAQQMRTVEDLGWFDRNWGEVLSSGLIDLIPGYDIKSKGARAITLGALDASARTVAQHQGEVALNEQRLLTGEEFATSAAFGGIAGGGIRGGIEGVSALRLSLIHISEPTRPY